VEPKYINVVAIIHKTSLKKYFARNNPRRQYQS